MKNTLAVILIIVCLGFSAESRAQRLQQPMGRSVVVTFRKSTERNVTSSGGSGYLVSWRKLAQEPEGTTYNLYYRTAGTTDYTKVNAQPLKVTNYKPSSVANNTEWAVTAINPEGVEGEKSKPFLYRTQPWSNVWFKFDFDNTVIPRNDYRTKYVWPMDLDGNGEIDAVVADRLFAGTATGEDDAENPTENTSTTTHKIQAYRLDGTLLWTVDMGPNVNICSGQNDMVLAYDINCDGRCEVIIRSSDGTRFWDKPNNTWGCYVGGNDNGDIDADGIIDYRSQTRKNPNFFISVIDGETGAELTFSELKYNELSDGSDSYSRNNRSNYMNASYAAMEGHYGIAYLDGTHPSLIMECEDRDTGGLHHGYILTWDYDWTDGVPSNWHHSHTWVRNPKRPACAEFHQIRILDSDGDGCDEMWAGGYGVNPHKDRFTSTGLAHGDRFIISDIDPDRPGLEGFAIQQSALLGQCLYDACTGERIKEWYLPSVYDVGRGACLDFDPSHKGYEILSYADEFVYDCKGEKTGQIRTGTMFEGFWWDGTLQREWLNSPGGSGWGTNIMVTKVLGDRLAEFSQESNWATHGGTGTRPAFMGDIVGDWREEIILANQNDDGCTGLVGYTTNIPTNYSIYTLQQDPHYRGDITTRGYYQHPNTGFYLGGNMPIPPLPPAMVTDLRWKGGSWDNGFRTFDMKHDVPYADGKSLVFDLSGDNTSPIILSEAVSPSVVYVMNPRGHDYVFQGNGFLTGNMSLIKSMQGTATFNNSLLFTGKTIISEGTLCVNATVNGPVELRAKGTLSGEATVNGPITFEGALNHEGCRLMPSGHTGVITFNNDLTIPGNVFIEVEADKGQSGRLHVEGNLTFMGKNTITVAHEQLAAGSYVIAECTGNLIVDVSQLRSRGLDGINYDFVARSGQLLLIVNETRAAATNVVWTGNESDLWDYKAKNFSLDGATAFVSGDAVVFDDNASRKNVTINDHLVTSGITFNSGTYFFSGEGGFSGDGAVTINPEATVTFNLKNSDYSGPTIVNGGTLTVPNLYDGGQRSSIGASSAAQGNLQLKGGTLVLSKDNMATDHIVTLTDTATIRIIQSNSSLSLKGQVSGNGYLVKDGPGQLNFNYSGANSFAGIIVRRGTIAQGAWNSTFGRAGSPMLLAGGEVHQIDNNSSSTMPVLNHVVTVEAGTTNRILGSSRGKINGSFRGSGNLTIETRYVRCDIGANFSDFEGTLTAKGAGGNFRLMQNVTDMSKTRLVVNAGTYVAHYAGGSGSEVTATTKIGSLSSPSSATDAVLGGSGSTYQIGFLNDDTQFYGTLRAAAIQKVGTGKLSLRTVGHTSPITVNGGILELYNTSSTAITTGSITVNKGGTLTGNALASAITVNTGGTLAAGVGSIATGTLRMSSLTLQRGATVRCLLTAASNSKFKVTGRITHSGDTLLIVVPPQRTLSIGDEIEVFPTGFTSATGDVIVKCQSEGIAYTFDTSSLNTDGKVRVTAVADGLNDVIFDDSLVDVYTIEGAKVQTQVQKEHALEGLPQGIYILQTPHLRQKVTKK
ncbi:MAG: cellulosome protein [Prevotella sp.]|nr:cellulosome protein [Prevotella sp.]